MLRFAGKLCAVASIMIVSANQVRAEPARMVCVAKDSHGYERKFAYDYDTTAGTFDGHKNLDRVKEKWGHVDYHVENTWYTKKVFSYSGPRDKTGKLVRAVHISRTTGEFTQETPGAKDDAPVTEKLTGQCEVEKRLF